MKKYFAFSLAEALMTLLIVSLIVVLSAPVLTKKSRKINGASLWTLRTMPPEAVIPAQNRDIMLGSQKSQTGIVVNGVLVFKNTKGETIGWIAEDGTSSFSAGSPSDVTKGAAQAIQGMSSEDLDKMVQTVSESLQRQKHSSGESQINRPSRTQRADSHQNSSRTHSNRSNSHSSYDRAAGQNSDFQESDLNKQLEELSKSMNFNFGS